MQRMINYFTSYRRLCASAQQYLLQHGKIRVYRKNSYYTMLDACKEEWNFILEGAVAMVGYHKEREVIERVYLPYYYFTGSKHAFSKSTERLSIKFLRNTIVYEIPNLYLQQAIADFEDLKDIYAILKQHQLLHAQALISILNTPSVQRLKALAALQPEVFNLLKVHERISYLNITNFRAYYISLAYFIAN